jgi:hypothetical protein
MRQMKNEVYEEAKAQMIGAINASSGPERQIFQHDLALLENVWEVWNSLKVLDKMVNKDREIIRGIFEMCQLLKEENDALKGRIAALEQKPVKKGLFR